MSGQPFHRVGLIKVLKTTPFLSKILQRKRSTKIRVFTTCYRLLFLKEDTAQSGLEITTQLRVLCVIQERKRLKTSPLVVICQYLQAIPLNFHIKRMAIFLHFLHRQKTVKRRYLMIPTMHILQAKPACHSQLLPLKPRGPNTEKKDVEMEEQNR